ncbi:NUDIX hydrolase [Thermodesulfobacteriota bacterium]
MKPTRFRKLTGLKWLNLFDVSYIDKKGGNKAWQLASRSNQPKCVTGHFSAPDAVVIVPFHQTKSKMVITKEFRVPLADYEYGFPAGLIDPGETVEAAARRELAEETGLLMNRVVKISPPIYSSAGMTDESVALVYAECNGEVSTENTEASERIEVLTVSPREAGHLCDDASLKFDAKAWIILSRYSETGRVSFF